jgi:hypothetical protein
MTQAVATGRFDEAGSAHGVPGPGGLVALELSAQLRTRLSDAAPVLGHVDLVGVAIPQQDLQFAGGQRGAGAVGAGSPLETAP